jgi:hypothetical protein
MLNVVAYRSEEKDGQTLITNSNGESISSNNIDELLAFVNLQYQATLKVCWNLDSFISLILRHLSVDKLKELASPTHTTSDGKLFYIPSVLVVVVIGDQKSFFYHLAQYFDESPELTDLQEVKQKAQDILNTLHRMNQYPAKLTSPVSIYESCVMNHLDLPSIRDLPKDGSVDEIIPYSEATIGRSWVEAFKIGHWNADEIYSTDLQSAYPYEASKLGHYRYAKIFQSDKIHEDADYGFMTGRVTIYDDAKVSPIMFKTLEGDTINPIGSWDKEGDDKPYVLTLDEYKWLKRWHVGEFKIYNGYFVKFWSEIQPYYKPMNKLFQQRSISPLAKTLAKRQAAGATGKIIQKTTDEHGKEKVGRIYDPISAGIIRTRTRLQVAEYIYQNSLQDYLIHVGTDGIQSEKLVPIKQETKMGSWKLNEPTPTLVLSSGLVYFGNKHPKGLTYDTIKELIQKKPKTNYYQTSVNRRQTLNDAITLNDLSHIGEIKSFPSILDLTALKIETDRVFANYPKNGYDLLTNKYESTPIKIHK